MKSGIPCRKQLNNSRFAFGGDVRWLAPQELQRTCRAYSLSKDKYIYQSKQYVCTAGPAKRQSVSVAV